MLTLVSVPVSDDPMLAVPPLSHRLLYRGGRARVVDLVQLLGGDGRGEGGREEGDQQDRDRQDGRG